MTDAQQLFDYARQQFNDIADQVDRHFDLVTNQLREWMPGEVRLYRPPPKPSPPPTTLESVQRWISTHRALTAAAAAFVVTGSVGAFVFIRNKHHKRKRRAKKSASGARTDVVVVAGTVANPLTSALYLDLERRGFVVYVVTNTPEDEHYIRSQNRVDLLPLPLDLVNPYAAREQLGRFHSLLAREHRAFDEAEPHKLNFTGLVLVPDTQSAPMRVESISSEEWSDAFNAKVLNPIAITQLFLPSITEHKAKLLLLTPSVTPSLKPPNHALESTVYAALEAFTTSLAAELKDSGATLSHLKLGSFDIPLSSSKQRQDLTPARRMKFTPLRQLHDSVFDTLVAKRPGRTVHVGRGSFAYDVIGKWVPRDVVGWMMGLGAKRKEAQTGIEGRRLDLESSWEKVEQEE